MTSSRNREIRLLNWDICRTLRRNSLMGLLQTSDFNHNAVKQFHYLVRWAGGIFRRCYRSFWRYANYWNAETERTNVLTSRVLDCIKVISTIVAVFFVSLSLWRIFDSFVNCKSCKFSNIYIDTLVITKFDSNVGLLWS